MNVLLGMHLRAGKRSYRGLAGRRIVGEMRMMAQVCDLGELLVSQVSGRVTMIFSLSGRSAQVRGLPGEEEQHSVLIVIGPADDGWR